MWWGGKDWTVAAGDGRAEAGRLEPILVSTWAADDEGPFDKPLTAEAETRRVRQLFDTQYPPGNFVGDLTRFVEAAYFGCDPWEAAIALAKHRRFLPSEVTAPAAKGSLRRLKREHGRVVGERYLRDTLYPEALMLALKERTERQYIRLRLGPHRKDLKKDTGKYLKDARGRRQVFSPNEVRDRSAFGNALFVRWLRKQTIKHVVRLLAEEVTTPAIINPQPNVRLKRTAAFYGYQVPVAPFSGQLSTQERTLLRLLRRHTSYAEVATVLGISTRAAKQRAYRLRLKQARR
jgi:hypothetical protein